MSKLYVVATPIGNLGDISQRALDTLKESDYILAEDTRHTIKLLNYYDIKTKMMAYHKFNEKKKTYEIIDMMKEQDIKVSIVTDAGTPCISDPGFEIVRAAHENEIEVLGIPGASAVINSLSIAGFDTQSFSFFGFIPRENKELVKFYDDIKKSNTLSSVVYESPKRIIKSLYKMKEVLGDINIAVMSDMTKIHEKVYRGIIEDVIKVLEDNENADKGEYAIVIEVPIREKKEAQDVSEDYCLEAKIVNSMVKEDLSMKEAVNKISKDLNISKGQVYDASLSLKKIFERN